MPDFDDDERPTQPDLVRFPCPACRDERGEPTGEVLVVKETKTGHSAKRAACFTCNGRMTVTREELALWRARGR